MAEYIERDKAIENAVSAGLCDAQGNMYGSADVVLADDIKAIPAEDVAPVVHGRWIKPSTKAWDHYCSVCKGPKPYFYGYGSLDSAVCPNCGAKMDKEEK